MTWFFLLFLVSGFCSILYEIVWLRLAMAQFGVTTALTSIVISMFMAGLGLGSWGSGRLIRRFESGIRIPALRLYALAELLIGISALLVPYQLLWGRMLLERVGATSSGGYYLGSGVCCRFNPGSVVRLHGRDHSAGHAGDPETVERQVGAIVQLSLPGQCAGRGHRGDGSPAAD